MGLVYVCVCWGGECPGHWKLHLSRPGDDTECVTNEGIGTYYNAQCEEGPVRVGGEQVTEDVLSEREQTELYPEGGR